MAKSSGSVVPGSFRFAEEPDLRLILHFIRELAAFEKLAHEVVATEDLLRKWLFVERVAEVVFLEVDGEPVAFALFFTNFSTFLGRPGLYLEDIFVPPEHRGCGYGKALLQFLARVAVERGYGRLEWWCLDWNQSAIDFYLNLGAEPMDDWTTFRVTGEALSQLGGAAPPR